MARGKIIKKLASKIARKRDAKKKYITEDGYVFEKKADGSLTDGDMTYKSLDELPVADWVNQVAEGKAEYHTKSRKRKDMKAEYLASKK